MSLNVPQTRLLHRCYIDATVSVSLTWTVVAVVPGVFFRLLLALSSVFLPALLLVAIY